MPAAASIAENVLCHTCTSVAPVASMTFGRPHGLVSKGGGQTQTNCDDPSRLHVQAEQLAHTRLKHSLHPAYVQLSLPPTRGEMDTM
jgi:hypothetical protein